MDISAEIAAIQAASQGSELRQPLVGALNKLNSGSLPAVTASDVGKILKVGANGWEVGDKSGYMPVPTATMQITDNDTYDVTNYSSAVVNVPPSGFTLISKTITDNGTYDPADDNADGYDEVIVNVSAGSTDLSNYIQSAESGNNSHFDTGYIPNVNTQFEIITSYDLSKNVNYVALFGARNNNNDSGATYFAPKWGNSTECYVLFRSKSSRPSWQSSLNNKKITLVLNGNEAFTINADDGKTTHRYIDLTGTIIDTGYSVFLFGLNDAGSAAARMNAMKLYRFRIYEGNTLVHEFIPWLDNNVACLKDTVTGNIKYCVGSNTFIYGSD